MGKSLSPEERARRDKILQEEDEKLENPVTKHEYDEEAGVIDDTIPASKIED